MTAPKEIRPERKEEHLVSSFVETLPEGIDLLPRVIVLVSSPLTAGPVPPSAPMAAPDKPPTQTTITVHFTLPSNQEQIRYVCLPSLLIVIINQCHLQVVTRR